MSTARACKSYKQSSSKWSKGRCHTCNRPKNEHKQTNGNSIARSSSKSIITPSKHNKYEYKQSITKPNIPSRIRSSTTTHSTFGKFAIGNKISVLYENKWLNAAIVNTSTNQIEVTYDDWYDSNEWINKSSKRLSSNKQYHTTQTQTNMITQHTKPAITASRNKSASVTSKIAAIKAQLNNSNNNKIIKKPIQIHKQSVSSGDCWLCADTKSNIITLSKCGHKLCKECLKQYIMITASDKLNIKCPFCPEILDQHKDVKSVLSHKEFAEMYLTPNLKQCLSSNCDNTVKLFGSSSARLDCSKCGRSWCINCKVSWHENMDCNTYKQTDVNEQKTKELLNTETQKGVTKQCPNCNVHIEKNDGCNHMHCRPPLGCNSHFCWKCGLLHQNHTHMSFPCY